MHDHQHIIDQRALVQPHTMCDLQNIIDGAPIKALESESEEFVYYVNEEVGDDFDDDHEGEDQMDEVSNDFNDDHKGEDVVFNCIRHVQLSHMSFIKSDFSQLEEKNDEKRIAIFDTFNRIGDMNCKVIVLYQCRILWADQERWVKGDTPFVVEKRIGKKKETYQIHN